jgi:hypothetical protein
VNDPLFTPGPWSWQDVPGAGLQIHAPVYQVQGVELPAGLEKPIMIYQLNYPANVQIAFERWVQFDPKGWHEMQVANAKLISAAPDLAQAIKVWVAAHKLGYGNMSALAGISETALKKAGFEL